MKFLFLKDTIKNDVMIFFKIGGRKKGVEVIVDDWRTT
jgi:hypothetical protein